MDIHKPADVAELHRLADGADILIQNLRPGVVEDAGIGPEAMLARHERLIYCSIWAFGYQGPLRMNPGFDPLLQAFGGMMSITGQPDGPPTFCGASVNDKATGCSVSSAHWRRCGSGRSRARAAWWTRRCWRRRRSGSKAG